MGLGFDQELRNYLRVRGEYFCACKTYTCFGELPPRARRILFRWRISYGKPGTTSACAENTTRFGLAT